MCEITHKDVASLIMKSMNLTEEDDGKKEKKNECLWHVEFFGSVIELWIRYTVAIISFVGNLIHISIQRWPTTTATAAEAIAVTLAEFQEKQLRKKSFKAFLCRIGMFNLN